MKRLRWTGFLRPEDGQPPRKSAKIVCLNGAGFSILILYHKARSEYLANTPFESSMQRRTSFIAAFRILSPGVRDRITLSHHTDCCSRFSGEDPGEILSGIDCESGAPKGSGPLTRCLFILFLFIVAGRLRAQEVAGAKTGSERELTRETYAVTTQIRIESETWWPTMSTAPLEAYTGSDGCVQCHADESLGKSLTSMQRAASKAEHAALLQQISAGSKRATNASYAPFSYVVRADREALDYTVTNGSGKESQRLEWVMGAGDLGQTFVYERDGLWYQSRMSAYAKPPFLDVTTGLKIDAGTDLIDALGRSLTPEELRHCFSCHTVHATSSRGFNPLHAELGLGCESCHGPGAKHAKKMMVGAAKSPGKTDLAIFNPSGLPPADSMDFCGACHRTFGDVTEAANQANDSSVVRFQPYRLEKSRCWRETQDARLTCVACHDPHEPLNRNAVAYDKHCLGCHMANVAGNHAGKVCPTGAKDQCVSCHMPKVAVASMHGEFTDHFIRVVKTGEGFAN